MTDAIEGAIDACVAAGATLPGALERGDLEVLARVASSELPWSFELYEKLALVPRLAASIGGERLGFADVLDAIGRWHPGPDWPFSFELETPSVTALGYAATSAGIERARRKHQRAWWAHERRARALIEAAARTTARTERAVVLGVGMGSDLPLEALAKRFDALELVEIDAGALDKTVARRLKRARNVRRRVGDVTGVQAELSRRVEAPDLAGELASYRLASPPSFTAPGADLVVSSMLLSQLVGVGRDRRAEAPRAWAQLTHRVQHDHVRGLLAAAETVVLLSDVAETATTLDGRGKARPASEPRPMIGSPTLAERIPAGVEIVERASWPWRRRAPSKRGELGSTLAVEALVVRRAAR